MDVLGAALAYAERGFFVLPVGRDKTPDTRHGVYDATHDGDTLRRWFVGQPGRGLALRMGGPGHLVALDCDVKHGTDGIASYRDLLPSDLGEPWQTTPSGGQHHVFTLPAGVKIGNGAGFLGPGLDHRGTNGYIVAYPTAGYRWQREPFGHIPELPGRIVDLLTKPKPRPTATGNGSGVMPPVSLESAIGRLEVARPGARNDTLNLSAYLVGRLVAAGKVSEADARRMLTATALSIGLTHRETAATIASGLGDGMAAVGCMPESEAIETAWRCLSWGLASRWPGRCGLSDRRVYLAHTLVCMACGQEVYHPSVRRLAELASIGSIATVKAANGRLCDAELIAVVKQASPGGFTPTAYELRTIRTITQWDSVPQTPLGNCSVSAHPTAQGYDVFCRKGLGPTAAVVWDSLRADGPATAAELAARTGRGRRSVEKALKAMTPVVDVATGEVAYMLSKVGAVYSVRDGVDLDAIAKLLHVDGEGKRRHERHERERERHSQGWQEVKRRQQSGTLPKPTPQTKDEVRRTRGAHERLDALRGVTDHTEKAR